jgi:hypothetical protein
MHVNSTVALKATTFRSPVQIYCALEVAVSATIRAQRHAGTLIPVPDDWPKSRLETERITAGRLKLPMGIHSRDRADKRKFVEDALQRQD